MAAPRLRYKLGDRPVQEAGYRLIEYLGSGQFGEVWKAEAPGGIEVAVKIIDLTRGEGGKEFSAIQKVKKLKNPYLTPIHACWIVDRDGHELDESVLGSTTAVQQPQVDDNGTICWDEPPPMPDRLVIAMALGDMSLEDRLEECRNSGSEGIPYDELLRYIEHAAEGLDYLHRPIHDLGHGPVSVVHRDVKPHNILIVGGVGQVCDFGLARAIENLHESKTATLSGTIGYMAPELFAGWKATPRSDQYALAVTYARLRLGKLPYRGGDSASLVEVMDQARAGEHVLEGLAPGEREVLARALHPEAERRYASCVEMVAALRGREPGPRIAPPVASPERRKRKQSSTSPGSTAPTIEAPLPDGAQPPSRRAQAAPLPPATRPRKKSLKTAFWLGALAVLTGAVVYLLLPTGSAPLTEEVLRLVGQGRFQEAVAELDSAAGNPKYQNENLDRQVPALRETVLDFWTRHIRDTWESASDVVGYVATHEQAAQLLQCYADEPEEKVLDARLLQAWSLMRRDLPEQAYSVLEPIRPADAAPDGRHGVHRALRFASQILRGSSSTAEAKRAEEDLHEYEAAKGRMAGDDFWILDETGNDRWMGRARKVLDDVVNNELVRLAYQHLDAKDFPLAVQTIREASTISLEDHLQTILSRWREHLWEAWRRGESGELHEGCEQLLRHFSGQPDAMLLRARASAQRGRYDRTLEELAGLEGLPADQAKLQIALQFGARCSLTPESAPLPADQLGDLVGLRDQFDPRELPLAGVGDWSLTSAESEWLAACRGRVTAANVRRLVEQKAFAEAAGELDRPELRDQRDELSAEVRQKWLADVVADHRAATSADSPNRKALEAVDRRCDELLARFPGFAEADRFKARIFEQPPSDLDAALQRTRDLVVSREYGKAIDELDGLAKQRAKLTRDQAELCSILWFIAKCGMSSEASQVSLEDLQALAKLFEGLPVSGAEPGAGATWAPTPAERRAVEEGRTRIADEAMKLARRAIEAGDFEQAREACSVLGERVGEFERDLDRLRAVVECRDPESEGDDMLGVLKRVATHLAEAPGWPKPNDARDLALALATIGERSHGARAADWELAIAILRALPPRAGPFGRDVATALGRAWEARIGLRIAEDAPPSQAEAEQLEADWSIVRRGDFDSSLVNLWRAELLTVLKNDPAAAADLLPRDVESAYRNYVRAVVYRGVGSGWDTVVDDLAALWAADAKDRGFIERQARKQKIVEAAVAAADELAKPVPSPLEAPYSSPQVADRFLSVLAPLADSLPPDDPALEARFHASLATAACHGTTPQYDLAWSSALRVRDRVTRAEGGDVALLAACVRSFANHPSQTALAPAEQQFGIEACSRLVGLLRDKKSGLTLDANQQGALFDEQLLRPVLVRAAALAEQAEPGVPRTVLHELFAASACYLWDQRYGNWPFPVADEVEKLATGAVDLYAALSGDASRRALRSQVESLIARGTARLELGSARWKAARRDAEQALTMLDALENAEGLRYSCQGLLCSLYYREAEPQTSHDELSRLLDESIAMGESAILGGDENPHYWQNLVDLMNARVLRANTARDTTFESQAEDLNRVVALAREAQKRGGGREDYPHLGAGNAYEDLACFVDRDVEKNYAEALRAFESASRIDRLSARGLSSVGRCLFRTVALSHVEPTKVGSYGFTDRGAVLEQALEYLQRAKRSDPQYAETYLWSGQVRMARGEFELADQDFETARKHAESLPNRVYYVSYWASSPLTRWEAAAAEGDFLPDALLDVASQRARELSEAPAYASLDGRKERSKIEAQIRFRKWQRDRSQGDLQAALEMLDGFSDATWSDLNRILLKTEILSELLRDEAMGWDWDRFRELVDLVEQASRVAVTWDRDGMRNAHYQAAYHGSVALDEHRKSQAPADLGLRTCLDLGEQHWKAAIDLTRTNDLAWAFKTRYEAVQMLLVGQMELKLEGPERQRLGQRARTWHREAGRFAPDAERRSMLDALTPHLDDLFPIAEKSPPRR